MPSRRLPARPHLDHLKHEAKALQRAFRDGDIVARDRVAAVLGPRAALKRTEAQRVIAREYGFPSWAALRARVHAGGGIAGVVDAFLGCVSAGDRAGARRALEGEPGIARASIHVAAVLGEVEEVRRLLAEDPTLVRARAGSFEAEPLLWLCHSPFHGESEERHGGLAAAARALLEAGADPNTRDTRYGVPALYAVTGLHNVPRIAHMLLDAGADVNDGESVFHAAERFHTEALELLLARGADLNHVGDWGNTPLYFLLRYRDVAAEPKVKQGLAWLLAHGADPNVRCGKERETALHVAARVGQSVETVRLLLEHGADLGVERGDGRTAWNLARRGGHDEVVSLLEEAGAEPERLSEQDLLMAVCGRGDADEARRIASPDLVESLDPEDLALLPASVTRGRPQVTEACLAAGFPVDATDEQGATALHHAAIRGRASLATALLAREADYRIRDREHGSAPLGWALFGADHVADPLGDYEATVRALLRAGARLTPHDHTPSHPGVREVLLEQGQERP